MGRSGGTCGVVSGALMVIGLKFGTADEKDKKTGARVYVLADRFIKEFKARNRTAACRELLGFKMNPGTGPQEDQKKIIQEKCPAYIEDAANIIEEILKDSDGGTKG